MLRRNRETIGCVSLYLILSFCLVFLVYHFELFPAGDHVWKYLNRAAGFIRGRKGTGAPGTHGILLVYAVYMGIIYFVSAVVWFVIGKKENRKKTGIGIGLLWFFMPANLQVFFGEGELGTSLFLSVLPLLLWLMYRYMEKGDRKAVWAVMILSFFMSFCSVPYAVLTFFGAINYWIVTGIFKGGWKRGAVLTAVLLPSVLTAFSGSVSNPAESGLPHYLWVPVFLLLLLGVLFSHKKTLPFFWTGMLLFLDSSVLFSPLMGILPGLKEMRMTSLLPIVVCYAFLGFLLWDTLKKQLVCAVCCLAVVDAAAVFGMDVIGEGKFGMEQTLGNIKAETLLEEACKTGQKVAFFSGEGEFALAEYLVAGEEWDILLTDDTPVYMKQALADSEFVYLFDRCLEFGNDTIVLDKDRLSEKDAEVWRTTRAAEKLGYELKNETEGYLLYHRDDMMGEYVVESHYEAAAIGSKTTEMVLVYPMFRESTESNLNAYSFEELSKYKVIYLNGFTYEDKETAEQLIVRLGESGVKILIEAEGIPADILSKNKEFLGVTANDISFEKGFPILYLQEEAIDCNLFAKGQENWQSVYLTGLGTRPGYFYDNRKVIHFLGTAGNENIIFVGLNLGYHYVLTGDPNVEEIYNDIFGFEKGEIPQRKLVR